MKPLTWILGAVLSLLGILGYLVQPSLVGLPTGNLSSTLHLIIGLLFVWAATAHYQYAKMALIALGLLNALFALLTFWKGSVFTIEANVASGLVYALVAALGLIVGFASPSDEVKAMPTPMPPPPPPPVMPAM